MTSTTDLVPLPPSQFRITPRSAARTRSSSSDNAIYIEISDLVVEHDKLLRSTIIQNKEGAIFGVILGNAFVIDSGERLSSKHFVAFFSTQDPESAFEQLYDTLFGCFVIVLIVNGRSYLYLDAGGCLSVVYAPDLKIVGSTAFAILTPTDYEVRFQRELYSRLDVAREGWFPSGLTAHCDVGRLLCNHRIDLHTFLVSRHWPKSAPIRAKTGEYLLQTLADTVQKQVFLILDNFNAALALTGGSDSRTLLSVARSRQENLATYIINAKNSDVDVFLSRQLAKKGGFTHNVLPLVPTAAEVVRQWHLRCGHAVGGSNAVIHTALAQLEDIEAIIEGCGGEVARGFFWKKSDTAETLVTASTICGRFGMPIVSEVVGATEAWLMGLPPGDAFFKLDLAYLELRVSAWAYAQSYVDPPLLHFSPLVSRRSFEAMFRLPVALKRGNGVTNGVIGANWPELNGVPFNRYGGVRDLSRLVRRATNFRVVKAKLRKMSAR